MVSHAKVFLPDLVSDLRSLGLRPGDLVLCHSSLSKIGTVDGGPATVVEALLDVIGAAGTLVVPAFTGQSDEIFTATTPTLMGAIPNAVLEWPGRYRSQHPQVSVAAIGADAQSICANQPLSYALGRGSPFDQLVRRGGKILLLGVGHNRSSMLHHSESLTVGHRRKTRRIPFEEGGVVSWAEVPDVGDDNNTFFPQIGSEFERLPGAVEVGMIGAAESRLFSAASYSKYARRRLAELLTVGPSPQLRHG